MFDEDRYVDINPERYLRTWPCYGYGDANKSLLEHVGSVWQLARTSGTDYLDSTATPTSD
jgi:hypothetical protein